MQVQDIQLEDEYEIDSGTKGDDEVKFEVASNTCMTRLGRAVHTFVRVDL